MTKKFHIHDASGKAQTIEGTSAEVKSTPTGLRIKIGKRVIEDAIQFTVLPEPREVPARKQTDDDD